MVSASSWPREGCVLRRRSARFFLRALALDLALFAVVADAVRRLHGARKMRTVPKGVPLRLTPHRRKRGGKQ